MNAKEGRDVDTLKICLKSHKQNELMNFNF